MPGEQHWLGIPVVNDTTVSHYDLPLNTNFANGMHVNYEAPCPNCNVVCLWETGIVKLVNESPSGGTLKFKINCGCML